MLAHLNVLSARHSASSPFYPTLAALGMHFAFSQIAIIVARNEAKPKPNQTKPNQTKQNRNRSAGKQSERVGFHFVLLVFLPQILILILIQIQLLHHADVCLFLI